MRGDEYIRLSEVKMKRPAEKLGRPFVISNYRVKID